MLSKIGLVNASVGMAVIIIFGMGLRAFFDIELLYGGGCSATRKKVFGIE